MQKLYSVKKPQALVSLLLKLVLCLSIVVFLVVAGLVVAAYFINNKTNVGEELITPLFRVFIFILPIDLAILFLLVTFASTFYLLSKKNVTVKSVNSLFELSRTTVLLFDESEMVRGKNCVVKEVVPLGKQNENEIIDIVGSIVSLIKNDNSVIHAIQKLSFIPVFSNSEVIIENNYYLASYKDRKYVFGEYGSFKYRQEEFVKTKVEPYLLKGFKTLLVGSYEIDVKTGKYNEFADVFGIIVIKNEINPDYKKLVEEYQNHGVKVKMISSHNAVMASENANAMGVSNAGKYISLNPLSDINKNTVNDYSVFGGLNEKQKQQIISLLQEQGEVVSVFASSKDSGNANCVVSNQCDIKADVVMSNDSSPLEVSKESVLLSNKAYRIFTLLIFKALYVDLYLIIAAVFTMSGYAFNYRPVGLGSLFALIAGVSIIFDNERKDPPSFTIMWRKILLSFGLSSLVLAAFFILYALQNNGILYTGINDLETCLSMCGLVLVMGASITTINLYLPSNKRRIIILSVVLTLFIGVTALLWILSTYFEKPLLGICFNKFNGQDNVSLAIALFMFASTYLIVNYLIDNYKERGDE